ncbi:conserved hypothetical protein [Ricinus communis]|uniref:Uncharacterized protein n=1 Tax=Ricinus communis TaxID=3988 RepID=B9SG37_RICCO|nr:conserved hypothetical protein [Ricinus communis]
MGPDLEKSKVTNGFLANKDQEDKQLLQCINNYEDDNFNEEALNKVPARNKDMEIDIIGCTKSGDNGEVEARYEEEDVTESMSSFGDSLSENENGSPLLGELEVDSRLCEGVFPASSTVFDGCGGGAFQMRISCITCLFSSDYLKEEKIDRPLEEIYSSAYVAMQVDRITN